MKIVFRVIANQRDGLGHAHRALTLADAMEGHRVVFACEPRDAAFVSSVVGKWYCVEAFDSLGMKNGIMRLEPGLLVNDMLNTTASYVSYFQHRGVRVVNFEDLGTGAAEADLTVNALFQEPQFEGGNILWGPEWFVLRDEFVEQGPNKFQDSVDGILIAYGGADPLNLTLKTLEAIVIPLSLSYMRIFVVIGSAYQHEAELMDHLLERGGRFLLVRQTGYMAKIMSRCQIAFCSNGRTVYELAHMNVPAIVTAQHERENTHEFACKDNGFMNLGVYAQVLTKSHLQGAFDDLLSVVSHRILMHSRMRRWDFSSNKEHVVGRMLDG